MPPHVTRIAVIDDADPRLKYSGIWKHSPDNVVSQPRGFHGEPFNATLTQSESSGASVSFEFEGYGISFYGTVDKATIPRYTCLVDGIGVPLQDDPSITNGFHFCGLIDLPKEKHTAALRLDEDSPDNPLMFDSLAYWPMPGTAINDATEEFWYNDTRITLSSSGWTILGDGSSTYYASEQNATVTVEFEGQYISMLGVVLNGTYTSGSASYSLDGAKPVSFRTPESQSETINYFRYPYFNLTSLAEGRHTLVVKDETDHLYQSPLVTHNFQIRAYSPETVDVLHPTINTSSDSELSAGVKAGIVVAVLVVAAIFLAAGAYLFIRRRRRLHGTQVIIVPPATTTTGASPPPATPSSAAPLVAKPRPGSADSMTMASATAPATIPNPSGKLGQTHHVGENPPSTTQPMTDLQYYSAHAYRPPPPSQYLPQPD